MMAVRRERIPLHWSTEEKECWPKVLDLVLGIQSICVSAEE